MILDLPGSRFVLVDAELSELQRERLERVLAEGGMPSLFFPSVVRVVQQLIAERMAVR